MSRPVGGSGRSNPARAVGAHFDGDLRRSLLDAALITIAEVGAERVSLRDVARRAGVSHAAPAHHFGDKAGLLTAVATEGFRRFVDHMATETESPIEDPLTRLARLGRSYAEFGEANPAYFDVMFRPNLIHASDPAFAAAGDLAFEALRAQVAACQRSGWRSAEDTNTLTVGAWSLAHGIAMLRSQGSLARHHDDDSLDGIIAIADALFRADEVTRGA